jgi:hypothetical protein
MRKRYDQGKLLIQSVLNACSEKEDFKDAEKMREGKY